MTLAWSGWNWVWFALVKHAYLAVYSGFCLVIKYLQTLACPCSGFSGLDIRRNFQSWL